MIEVAATPEQYKGTARILLSAKELLNNVEICRDLDRSSIDERGSAGNNDCPL